jgi:soluble lytic murein transglycosylase
MYRPRWAAPLLYSGLWLAAAAGPSPARAADIWMGTDSKGVITFTDTPSADEIDSFQIIIEDMKDRPAAFSGVDGAMLKKNLDAWDPIILRAASRHDVAPELIKAVMLVESGMNPRATSPRGARGLMQLMPGTADELGVGDAYDPEDNVMGGVRYLRRMLEAFGNQREALAAYNAGPNAVKKHGGIPPFDETRWYVEKVQKYYRWFLTERPVRRT